MKKTAFIAGLVCMLLPVIIAGCGGTGGGDNGAEVPPSNTITLTGSLGTASPKTGAIAAGIAESGTYTVVVINNSSNKTYNTTASAGGSFSLNVASGLTYLVSFIKDGTYIGPTVFSGSGSSVNTAISPTANTNLGTITVDEDNGYATTASTPSSVNTAVTASAANGKPLGAGNDGKTQNSGITNRSDSDKDRDGIPNIFDADEDNDGIRNGITNAPSSKAVVSDVVESVYMTSNIWADHDTSLTAKDMIDLRLHVVPETGKESLIASVTCTGVPSSISSIATVRWAESLGSPSGYPTENSLWSASSYNLYKTTALSQEEWVIAITPKAIMNVGDTFTIRVTYTDATYEDFFVSTSYVLTDWAKVTEYNNVMMPSISGTSANPVTFNADFLEIEFSKPLDENGNVLNGLTYSLRYAETSFDAGEGRWLVPGTVSEPSVTDLGGATLEYTISTTNSATYYVTPVAESYDGQRNGEETWFTRQ